MKFDIVELLRKEYSDVLDTQADYVKESIKEFSNSEIHINNMQELSSKGDHYIENCLLKEILAFLSELGYDQSCKYFAAITNSFAAYVRDGKDKVIISDDSLNSGLIEFYLLVLGWANDIGDLDNFEYCFKNIIRLLDAHCIKKELGTIDPDMDKKWFKKLPGNIQEIAANCYWVSWSFMIMHELGHLILNHTQTESDGNQELDADQFAYEMVLRLIERQNNSNDGVLSVYQGYTCFAPMMLFDFYYMIDYFQRLIYPSDCRKVSLRFEKRINNLIETEIHYFDISRGNDVYNNYLEVIDYFKEQLLIKYLNGKLDIIPDIN